MANIFKNKIIISAHPLNAPPSKKQNPILHPYASLFFFLLNPACLYANQITIIKRKNNTIPVIIYMQRVSRSPKRPNGQTDATTKKKEKNYTKEIVTPNRKTNIKLSKTLSLSTLLPINIDPSPVGRVRRAHHLSSSLLRRRDLPLEPRIRQRSLDFSLPWLDGLGRFKPLLPLG